MKKKITIVIDTDKVKSKDQAHKHHKPDKWLKNFNYKDNKQTEADINDEPKMVSSFKSYRYNTFYKVQSLSDNNEIFDYYRIRKPELEQKNYAQKIKRKAKKPQQKKVKILPKVHLTKKDLNVEW